MDASHSGRNPDGPSKSSIEFLVLAAWLVLPERLTEDTSDTELLAAWRDDTPALPYDADRAFLRRRP